MADVNCETFQVKKTENNVDLTINLQKVKPKRLAVDVYTLPCGSSATISLIEGDDVNTILFGIPRGEDGDGIPDIVEHYYHKFPDCN